MRNKTRLYLAEAAHTILLQIFNDLPNTSHLYVNILHQNLLHIPPPPARTKSGSAICHVIRVGERGKKSCSVQHLGATLQKRAEFLRGVRDRPEPGAHHGRHEQRFSPVRIRSNRRFSKSLGSSGLFQMEIESLGV